MPRIVYTYKINRGPQDGQPNILMRVVVGVVSVLLLVASAFLGVFLFLAALGVVAVAGTVLAVRFWLFKRKVEEALKQGAAQESRDRGYIDVEYEEKSR